MGTSLRQISGIITKIRSNAESNLLTLCLQEHSPDDDDDDDDTAQDPTNHFKTPTGPTYNLRLSGSWVKFVQSDFVDSLRASVYLDRYNPHWHPIEQQWQFYSGIRANLIIPDDKRSSICKRIDVVLLPQSRDQLCLAAAKKVTQIKLEEPSQISSHHLPRSQPDLTIPLGPTQPTENMIKSPERALPSESKRPRLSEAEQSHDQPISLMPEQSPPIHPPHSDPSVHPQSVQQNPQKATNDDTVNAGGSTISPRISILRARKSTLVSRTKWSTLKEIQDLSNNFVGTLNVMGMIKRTRTETCEKAGSGTCDYKMTIYITDLSRPIGSREVTCNLFWKTEQDCPPWLKSSWRVIFLWSVRKRKSDVYNTQLIGPSGSFGWALWSPGYLGSAQQLELGNRMNHHSRSDPSGSLKDMAHRLYETYIATEDALALPDESGSRIPTSVVSRICDLKSRPIHETVDLCVQIIDLWQNAPENDRITVTDYTPLPTTKPVNIIESTLHLNQFHVLNGGNSKNWKITSDRLLVIYISQPILNTVYQKIKKTQDENFNENQSLMNVHDLRCTFENQYVKLNCINLRYRQNDQSLYALMQTSNPNIDDNNNENDDMYYFNDFNYDCLSSRIQILDHLDPIVLNILKSKQQYQSELSSS